MPDISIIIVAYNPDFRVFERCLEAISRLKKNTLEVECLLIDNNSNPPLSENKMVRRFLEKCPGARIIIEKRQGSGYARICGFENSQAPLIVTFDDDNEPDENYLLGVMDFAKRNPATGVFGPGIVKVEYVDGAKKYFDKYKYVFQELHLTEEKSGTTTGVYHEYYPAGTGMVARRKVVENYCEAVRNGEISAVGRIGNILTSCEDSQLVWLSLKKGFAAGRTPLLKLNHLINGKKANFEYWKKLTFGGGFSFLPARFEIFPEERKTVKNTGLEIRKSILRIGKVVIYNFYKPRFIIISIASQLGILISIYQINDKEPPKMLVWLKNLLGLD